MRHALIIENDPADIRTAQRCARTVGFEIIEAKANFEGAQKYLERAVQSETRLPDVIILDLNLGHESGHEVLRLWHTTPILKGIPMIVWSIYGDEHKLIQNSDG